MQNLSGQLQICHQHVPKMGYYGIQFSFYFEVEGFYKKKT
jgi:hypothetical protein